MISFTPGRLTLNCDAKLFEIRIGAFVCGQGRKEGIGGWQYTFLLFMEIYAHVGVLDSWTLEHSATPKVLQ